MASLVSIVRRLRNSTRSSERGVAVQEGLIPSAENFGQRRGIPLTVFAAKGNLDSFREAYNADTSQLNVKDYKGRAPIHEAAGHGHLPILQFITQNGGDLNIRDHDGNTALHLAVESSEVDCVKYLLDAGCNTTLLNCRSLAPLHVAAEGGYIKSLDVMVRHRYVDINLRGEQGGTALHFSANMNTGECAKLLLEHGALPNMKCDNGFYPIHAAAKSASADTLSVLMKAAIARGYKREDILSFTDMENNTILHSAVHSGNLKVVEVCLKAGSSLTTQHQDDESTPVHFAASQGNLPLLRLMYDMQSANFVRSLSLADVNHMTPLHAAAIFDHVAAAEFLIEKGANLNSRDKDGNTPLLLAASKGAWGTVTTLLGNKADFTATDHSNRNFLHLAVKFGGRLDDLGCNILQGVQDNVDEKDDSGCTPLHYACAEGHKLAVDDLIAMGASASPKNNLKQSPFHFAARHGRLSICRRLLETTEGCSIINETDSTGQTALHMAAERGHTRVVSCLLEQGAVTGRDHDSNTALHLAASHGFTRCMRLLLGVHSNLLDITNSDGDTALHLAALHGHTNAVTLLMSTGAGFVQNNDGLTFFDNAIQHGKDDVAMGIVVHERWEEAMDLNSTLYTSPMVGLIRQLPEVCLVVLERSMTMSNMDARHREFYIDFNFKYLRSAIKPLITGRSDGQQFKPMPELNMMVKAGRVECLSHPVCINYLRMKWNRYGRWYCSMYLLIYLTYLALLTVFVCTNDSMDHYDQGNVDNDTIRALHGNRAGGHYYSTYNTVFLYIIEVYAGLNIIKELIQMVLERWRYFTECQKILNWLVYVLTLLFVSPFLGHYAYHWQWEIGAFAVFLAWFNLLVFLQRFEFFGLYVVMFVEILKTLLQACVVFLILIIGFGLTFYILMSHEEGGAYRTPGISILRVVTMMQELEYVATYSDPYADNNVITLHYAHGTLFFCAVYFLLMCIIFMNLLIGLAVGDIQSVLTNARLQRLTLRVNLHSGIDRRMPKELLLKLDKPIYRIYPNRPRILLKSMWSQVTSYDDEISGLYEGQTAAHNKYIYTELFKQKNRIKELSSTLEKSHGMLSQIARRMEISTEGDVWDEGMSHHKPPVPGQQDPSSSLGRQMLQQSMSVARWKRYIQIHGGRSDRGRGRGRGGKR